VQNTSAACFGRSPIAERTIGARSSASITDTVAIARFLVTVRGVLSRSAQIAITRYAPTATLQVPEVLRALITPPSDYIGQTSANAI
jgi:hypothetical protein